MKDSIKITTVILRSLPFGSIGVGYIGIGTVFNKPFRIVHIQNLTDAGLMFSFNGVDDHFPLLTYGYFTLDIPFNKSVKEGFYTESDDRLYVKRIGVPTTGSVYVTGFY